MKPQYPLKATNETGDVTVDIQGFTVPDSSITASSGIVNIATSTGDVTGPSSATDNAAAVFDSTTGKVIKDGASVNVLGKQFVKSFTTTATAAGTTTLTVASNPLQAFTGVTTQTVVLPVVTTLPKVGFQFTIINNSTGSVTVNSSGANLVQTVLTGTTVVITCVLLTGTTAASWDVASLCNIDSSGNLLVIGNMGVDATLYIGPFGGAGASLLDSLGVGNAIRLRSGADAVSPVWITNTAGNTRVTADVTNATATMANITDLSVPVLAGRHYTGRYVFKCSDSTAAEGIAFDFDGGTATMTAFAAGATLLTGGTTVAVTTVSSALATDFNWTTITGETWIAIEVAFTVNAGGTFIPRFCQGTAHTSGTATVSRGSNGQLIDSL